MVKRAARIDNESGSSPHRRHRLVNEQNEKARGERHDRKHVTLVAVHPPGGLEKAEENDPRNDRCAEKDERRYDGVAQPPAPVEPEQTENRAESRPGQSDKQV